MPLPKDLRSPVVNYVLQDLAPGKTPDQLSMEWFLSHFSFVDNQNLKKHLAESFYQARFSEKLREALGLRSDFNNLFLKMQIILYASIYEALIDYALEKNRMHPDVKAILEQVVFSPVPALSKAAELIYKENGAPFTVVTCKKKTRTQQLKEVQFKDRLAAAVKIGFVDAAYQGELEALYASRNKIHIIPAASADFKPDSNQSSKAFRNMFAFLAHAQKFFQQLSQSPY